MQKWALCSNRSAIVLVLVKWIESWTFVKENPDRKDINIYIYIYYIYICMYIIQKDILTFSMDLTQRSGDTMSSEGAEYQI